MKQASCLLGVAFALLATPFGCGDSTSSPGGGAANDGGGGQGGADGQGGDGEGGSTGLAGGAGGNEPTAASGGQPQGGDPNTLGGQAALAGAGAATDVAGAAATDGGGGAGGDGGSVTTGCKVFADCNDGIPCTVDRCIILNHTCSHQADSSLCEAAEGECVGCDKKLGCVPRATTTTELLLDKDFDQLSGVWKEASVTFFYAIFESQYADTPDYLVEFGPAAADANEQEYATLSQAFVVPAGTQKLTFTGRYELIPGGNQVAIEDSTRVALHLGASASEAYLFNVWLGVEPEVQFWKGFKYEASRAEISSLLGKNTRLQFKAHTWDTIFDFDTVSLKATVCPD